MSQYYSELSEKVSKKLASIETVKTTVANGELTIEVDRPLDEDMILMVVNSSGRTVMLDKVYASEHKTRIDMSDLERGVFIIKLYNDDYSKIFRVLLIR